MTDAAFFPLGATPPQAQDRQQFSLWRETSFILKQIINAIAPDIGLNVMFDQWTMISEKLKDSRRQRQKPLFTFALR